MDTWRICEHCEHCVYDVGSGLQCDFDYPNLKSVTEEMTCRYFSLNEDYVDELAEEAADLRAKLAAAEHRSNMLSAMVDKYQSEIIPGYRSTAEKAIRERDDERAHNAMLRQALERCRKAFVNLIDLSLLPSEECEKEAHELAQMCFSALHATPSDSAAKVQGLASALELMVDTIDDQLGGGGYVPEFGVNIDEKLEPWASIFDAQEKAQKALAEWRDA